MPLPVLQLRIQIRVHRSPSLAPLVIAAYAERPRLAKVEPGQQVGLPTARVPRPRRSRGQHVMLLAGDRQRHVVRQRTGPPIGGDQHLSGVRGERRRLRAHMGTRVDDRVDLVVGGTEVDVAGRVPAAVVTVWVWTWSGWP